MTEKSTPEDSAPPAKPSRLRRWTIRLVIVVGVLLMLGAGFVGVAEHKTSQPEFCGSCHIMESYYETWSDDLHGKKLGIACVECHYAPGEQTTLKAKFRGLSQVTSYFSGRYGSGRPRAHVSNLSCLTAKCHGDMKFMDKDLQLGTAKFSHSKHLQRDEELEKPHQERLTELRKVLREALGDEHYSELERVASTADSAKQRYGDMESLCKKWNSTTDAATLREFSQLLHRKVRVAQLNDLQCTNCHAYHDTDQETLLDAAGHHFQVATTTCYTCHFNNEDYNTGTSTCLTCHTPPQKQIVVHAEITSPSDSQPDSEDTVGTKLVKMDHAEMLARKVSCISCHADAIQKDAIVTRRDCERCHDRPEFFKDWKQPFTLDLVTHYHDAHMKQQRAKCVDCHAEIHHKLMQEGASFLTSALANCTRCHPNHHMAQVNLLLGRGGTGVTAGDPNLMFGSRTNCTGCHVELSGDPHGGVIKATEQSCIACHGDRHKNTFAKWKLGLELVMEDAETAHQNAKKALDDSTGASEEAQQQARELISSAESDLQMVKTGNGLHNITYAMELLDSVTSRCQQAITVLSSK